MIGTVAHTVYPASDDEELKELAGKMEHATQISGVTYHIDRYGPDGLFGDDDPAERSYLKRGPALKVMYRQLESVSNALIVTARVMPHLVGVTLSQTTDITHFKYNGGQDE